MTIPQALALAMQKHRAGDLLQAEQLYREILAQQSTHLEALHWLGLLSAGQGRPEEAISLLQQVVTIAPNEADCWNNLGIVLLNEGKSEDAADAFARAAALKPDAPEIFERLGISLQSLGRLAEAVGAYRKALLIRAAVPTHRRQPPEKTELGLADTLLVLQHHNAESDPKALYADHAIWNQLYCAPLAASAPPHANDPDPNRRIRVGYVSSYLSGRPIGRFLAGLIANHDHPNFEIFGYSDTKHSDAMTDRLRSWCDGWRETAALTDEQLAQLVREDRIDILIDLGMHTVDNRLMVFARKPAPVQITYLAYCSTTGLQTMDYRLSDSAFDPDDAWQPFYSEKTLRLKSYWCYPAPAEAQNAVVPSSPSAATDTITFGCLNDFIKFNQATAQLWSGVLHAVPNSRLLLHAPENAARAYVRAEFVANGINPARMEFVGLTAPAEYFRRYQQIDIALDPTPWCGGTTTCDSLWMGTPVVTLVGKNSVSRGGLSIMLQLGLVDLVAYDTSQYVTIAAALARDPARRHSLRASLRSRMLASRLMNAPAFARDFERVLRIAWTRWCANIDRR